MGIFIDGSEPPRKGPWHYTRWIGIYGAGMTVAGGVAMLTIGETQGTASLFSTGAGVLVFGSFFGLIIDTIRALRRMWVRARGNPADWQQTLHN